MVVCVQARPPGDREEKQQEYSDASNRRGRPHRDPGCTVFVHNVSVCVTQAMVMSVCFACVFCSSWITV